MSGLHSVAAMSGLHLGLRARASLAVLVLVLALTLLVTVVVKRSDSALHDVERARFEVNAAQLADAVSYGVLARSDALVSPALDAFAQNPDLVRVDVIAGRDESVAHRDGRALGSAFDVEVTMPVKTRASAPGTGGAGAGAGAADDDELAAFGVPASAEPRVIGSVRVVFSSKVTEEIQRKTRREIVLAALGLGLFGLLGAGLLMTSVVRRVRTVADAAAKVRSGKRDVVVDVKGDDELARLAADFNAMTRALDDAANALAERESLAAIGRATAVIAHELKNPLGIVLGAAQIVGNAQKPMEARQQAAAIVEEEVRRLSRTLEGLLSYAKPKAPEQKVVDVRAACEQAATRATLAGGPMHGKAVVVAGESTMVRVDEAQLQQVLLNLIQNAGQAGATLVKLTIAVPPVRIPAVIEVSVEDDGPGVAAEMREQLFQPFATNKQRGTGLGLAASRRIARDNGGNLEHVEGSRFVLTLRPPALKDLS